MQTTMNINPPVKHISLHVSIRDVDFGENVTVIEPVNIYGCKIGSKTFIGPFVEIQKEVIIGEGCKIQSHTFICELVTIGDGCFIGHGVCLLMMFFRPVVQRRAIKICGNKLQLVIMFQLVVMPQFCQFQFAIM